MRETHHHSNPQILNIIFPYTERSWDLKSSCFSPILCSATEWDKVSFLHYGFAIITFTSHTNEDWNGVVLKWGATRKASLLDMSSKVVFAINTSWDEANVSSQNTVHFASLATTSLSSCSKSSRSILRVGREGGQPCRLSNFDWNAEGRWRPRKEEGKKTF